MTCYEFEGLRPIVKPTAYIHPSAQLIGDVFVGEGCFVGPCAVLRGDMGRIVVERGSNIQDNCVVHIAFVPSVSIGEAEALLRSAGARVVEGPDATGIFGVSPASMADTSTAQASARVRALSARLRTDARVRWVEPLSADASVETPER